MKRAMKKHWFEMVISLMILAISIMGISTLFGYMHRSNDDVLLRSIASGGYTGKPDAHLIYIMYPLGIVFKGLYSAVPSVSWYDVFIVTLHYFCWWAIVIRIGAVFESKWKKLVAMGFTLCLLFILDLPYVVLNQYTALAGVCAATAVLWLVLLDAEKKESLWVHITVICTLMTATLWLRKEVFFMALPIGGCILLYQWLLHAKEKEFKRTWLKSQGILLGIILAVGAVSMLADYMAYTGEEWQNFKRYNQARTDIFDYYNLAPYDLNRAAYEAEGIDTAEYEVMNSMSLALMPELDTAKMERLANLAKWHKQQMEQYYSVYRKTMYLVCDVVLYNDVQPIGFVLTIACAALLALLVLQKRKAGALALLMALAYEAAFVGYFIWKSRFPERVSFGLYAMLLLLVVGMAMNERRICDAVGAEDIIPKDAGNQKGVAQKQGGEMLWNIFLLAVSAFVLANVGMYQYRNISDEVKEYRQGIGQWQQVQYYASRHADSVFLIKANMAGLRGDVMSLTTTSEPSNTLLLGTWLSESPHYHLRSRKLGLDVIGEDYAQKDNIYLLQLEKDNVTWLTEYYTGRGYDVEAVVTDCIDTVEGTIHVVKLQ